MNVLVTGFNGYISRNVGDYLSKKENMSVYYISLRNNDWKNQSFSKFDVVFHSIGIIPGKETCVSDYYKINEDLTKEVAIKAKSDGVTHFIFLSSMSVYGISPKIKDFIEIDENTPCNPICDYGKSKYQAENEIIKLEGISFLVSIIRAPSIYGKNYTAYFEQFYYLLNKLVIQPDGFKCCKRASLYIENLSELVYLLIMSKSRGIICPQDREVLTTVELVKQMGTISSKRRIYSKILYFLIRIFLSNNPIVNNIWGSIAYSRDCSKYFNEKYKIYSTEEAIRNCFESDQ